MSGECYAGERNPMNQGRGIFVEALCLVRIAPQPAEVSLLAPDACRVQGVIDPPTSAECAISIEDRLRIIGAKHDPAEREGVHAVAACLGCVSIRLAGPGIVEVELQDLR